ncbi:sodium:proton antiporter [Cytobacillus firmus]|uniref:Na+/H+ antiporter NhaC n=2 Tax=Cytobacillus firmus TaxID=1399 RepID=UPI000E122922|nr:Na+/H+ antiporter NhaC [Cytobacillus firmus]MBG9541591.1 sodium:proton antiporter [Cytobacillus firmus]MBG9545911.1 sodium:proton antiporter [Cytobacillus firmus]MBG9555015.1 sodium:proton antiporter [Cytobacillus firmus]MBG9558387.1 sodium:proton antiporter [Cytobacillus firmus]MBG9573686.1 sodium:proton antiporter [Cytobacillus firmus]
MKETTGKKIPFWFAVLPLLVMIAAMIITIVKFEGSPHVPLIAGTIVSAFIAWRFGYKWNDIEEGFYKGIKLALPAILIIIMVGLTIGSWIGGGIVATMVFYGLKLMTPSMFLVSICIICAIVTLAIGSSWSTMGTIGVAGMGIGISMGIPAPMVAGAIISGAYFGDKMSPLSDTTNLAAGITGTDLFEHIKHMFFTTLPALAIAIIAYWFLGRQFGGDDLNNDKISGVMNVLSENFVISPWLLLVPLIVIGLVAKKVPALPALAVGVFLGWLCHIFVQGGAAGDAVNTLQGGFSIESGNTMVDELFNRGGIDDMMYTVSLTIVAMAFGGVMEQTGMLKAIVEQILKLARSARSLVATTVLSAFFTNVAAAEQYISILLPGRMYTQAFKDKNLQSKNLSRALEDGGTVTSVFVPWNTCAVFIMSTLAVHPFEYAPYAILNFAVPILAIIFAMLGYKITFMSDQERKEMEENDQLAS